MTQEELLEAELAFQAEQRFPDLPRGPVHADLFRDNALWEDGRISGVVDFYFAGVDCFLYDVAVCANDWCLDGAGLQAERLRAFLGAYNAVRPFTAHERAAWLAMLRAAALRFWLSRLYDFICRGPECWCTRTTRSISGVFSSARRFAGPLARLMQPRIVDTKRGARWLADGWRLFRAAPLGWIAIVFAYWLLMTVVSILPLVGVAAASILVPAFSVGFMAAARLLREARPGRDALLFDGFATYLRSQVILGVVYFACLGMVLAATTLADDGALAGWMLTGRRPEEEVLRSDAFLSALALAAALYMPVLMMFWFAPPLAWHATAPARRSSASSPACSTGGRFSPTAP